jgi:hypothetical protein
MIIKLILHKTIVNTSRIASFWVMMRSGHFLKRVLSRQYIVVHERKICASSLFREQQEVSLHL